MTTNPPRETVISCHTCGKLCKSKAGLTTHMNMMHLELSPTQGEQMRKTSPPKVEPTIEGWKKYYKMANGNIDDYIGFAFGKCMDMGSEIGGLMSVKRLPMFTEAIKYFQSHSLQEAKAEERDITQKAIWLELSKKLNKNNQVIGRNDVLKGILDGVKRISTLNTKEVK